VSTKLGCSTKNQVIETSINNFREILEIADRKRRFFSHPVILRGLMPRSAVLSRSPELMRRVCEGAVKELSN